MIKKKRIIKVKPASEERARPGVFARINGRNAVRLYGKPPRVVLIPENHTKGAEEGQKVLVRLPGGGGKGKRAYGEIVSVFAKERNSVSAIISIAEGLGMPHAFVDAALAEAAAAPAYVSPEDVINRRDLRTQPCITIDGADAKDIDDAVFLEVIGSSRRLYVHIADVAHYVPIGSALDTEAFGRGTSAYLADTVIPMLPAELSNGICSLNAGCDRLAVSCMMELDEHGNTTASELFESVIRVSGRMTYDEVQGIIQNTDDNSMLHEMNRLAKTLKSIRAERGAIELISHESKFIMDKNGEPIDIVRREQNDATSVIEEFMILCNEVVASTMKKNRMPLLYRVHDESSHDKLDKLYALAGMLGIKKRGKPAKKTSYSSKTVQQLIDKANDTRYADIINRAALGCMQQAVYSSVNKGHFGLASECYCHFTAPIRRYPDLFCHRMVKAFVRGRNDAAFRTEMKQGLGGVARDLSVKERRAVEAEREVDDFMKIKYMSHRLGQVYTGVITSVRQWGMYVELPNTVEGLVRYASLTDDYYAADEENYRAVGQGTRRVYRLGDTVRVCAAGADIERRHLDFVIVDKNPRT